MKAYPALALSALLTIAFAPAHAQDAPAPIIAPEGGLAVQDIRHGAWTLQLPQGWEWRAVAAEAGARRFTDHFLSPRLAGAEGPPFEATQSGDSTCKAEVTVIPDETRDQTTINEATKRHHEELVDVADGDGSGESPLIVAELVDIDGITVRTLIAPMGARDTGPVRHLLALSEFGMPGYDVRVDCRTRFLATDTAIADTPWVAEIKDIFRSLRPLPRAR